MPLIIPDETLKQAGLTETEMKIEIAYRLCDARKLYKPDASRLADLSRVEFESELLKRGLPLVHIDEESVKHDLWMADLALPKRGSK